MGTAVAGGVRTDHGATGSGALEDCGGELGAGGTGAAAGPGAPPSAPVNSGAGLGVNAGSGGGPAEGAVGGTGGAAGGGGSAAPGPGIPAVWASAVAESAQVATMTHARRDAAHIYCYWATLAIAVPSCYRFRVGRFGAPAALAGLISCAWVGACSRTGFEQLEGVQVPDVGLDAQVPPVIVTTPPPQKPPPCVPEPEQCNGKDDDCNGLVDDGLPAIPCPGGGERYCVAGRYSACPVRCDVCVPGSERVCFLSYCTFWAVEKCTSDGRSFGACREEHVPPECEAVASAHKDSPELEQCCIDNGYCCHDEFDLDSDGNTREMLGSCAEVSCTP